MPSIGCQPARGVKHPEVKGDSVGRIRNSRVRLARLYRLYLEERDSARFASQVSLDYSVTTLERLLCSDKIELRRAAVLALTMLGDYSSNLAVGKALRDDDRGVRMLAEDGIELIWNRAGNAAQQQRLNRIRRLNQGAHFEPALDLAELLCREAPAYAEAWNQRGISQFFLGNIEDAIHSCWQALAHNPMQFESAVGLGHAYLELDERQTAIECFQQAVELNPNLESIRIRVVRMMD